jgi:hypothetical protein
VLDVSHNKEMERLALRFGQIDKYAKTRKEVDWRQDMEYQRNVYVFILYLFILHLHACFYLANNYVLIIMQCRDY